MLKVKFNVFIGEGLCKTSSIQVDFTGSKPWCMTIIYTWTPTPFAILSLLFRPGGDVPIENKHCQHDINDK